METTTVSNKEIVQSLIEGFDKSDVELILSHLAEDIQWNIVGEHVISGKKEIGDFFSAHPDMKMLSSTKDHFVVDGNTVAVDGEVECLNEGSGERHDMFYCDIYDLQEGKVKKMTSYCINKKKDNTPAV
jgi:ketosteroid isomerase-like protein